MIDLDPPASVTIAVSESYIILSFHRPLGLDGQQYIDELESLNQYPGITGGWGKEGFSYDGCYLIKVSCESGYSLYKVADAIADKFQELGLSCLKLFDKAFNQKTLEKEQRFSDFLGIV